MKILPTFLFLLIAVCSIAQDSIATAKKKNENAWGFRFIPSKKAAIYGIAPGLFGGDVLCKDSTIKRSNGISIQLIGQGISTPFAGNYFRFENILKSDSASLVNYSTKSDRIAIHNGLMLSTFGTWSHTINGISLSALSSMGQKMNGFSFNLLQSKYAFVNGVSFALFNQSHCHKGIQLGMINKTAELKGFQFGIWNVNEKRKLPLVNWSFKN